MAENTGIAPPDYNTLAGQVRVLIGDTDPTPLDPPVTGMGEYMWYSDVEIAALGALMDDSPIRTAIWVLSQVAVSEALIIKKWKTDDLQVDGPAAAAAIEKIIARLSAQLEAEDGFFDIVGGVIDCAPGYAEGALRPYPHYHPVPAEPTGGLDGGTP